jgi:hypothetical protein
LRAIMADSRPRRPSQRISSEIPPRWGFVKGVVTGAVIEAPALAAGVWLLARLGLGDPELPYMDLLRITAVFTGIAAVLTAGGIGRLAAQASITPGRRIRAMVVAARAHAVAGPALALIAVVPHGDLPHAPWPWIWLVVIGATVGAACGAAIGLVCGGVAPVGIGDVVALARTPTHALRQLLSPEDLMKLGAAVRQRTSQMFVGMFEPAQRPPGAPESGTPKPRVVLASDDATAPTTSPKPPRDPPE